MLIPLRIARDLLALGKPRILVLLAITCMAGMLVAAQGNTSALQLGPTLAALASLVLTAWGANTVNMWYDRDIDPRMVRTRTRPIPAGRIRPTTALLWGIFLVITGTLIGFYANFLTALMSLSGALFYIFIYTFWLKRLTPQNIVIGGAAGAFPPLVGWAAVQGDLTSPLPWLMFALIFFWTPPHFWALALISHADYTKAGVPMYPVAYGEPATRLAIMRYMLVLIPVSMLPALWAPLGPLYALSALALGLWWGHGCWQLFNAPEPTASNILPAKRAFRQSLSYLALIFLALVLDSWL
jgi:heme o synthase